MLIRRPPDILSSEITPESAYLGRREFIAAAGVIAGSIVAPSLAEAVNRSGGRSVSRQGRDELTPIEDMTGYNNFYEFGTGKDDPIANAQDFKAKPWTVKVEGGRKRSSTKRATLRRASRASSGRRDSTSKRSTGAMWPRAST